MMAEEEYVSEDEDEEARGRNGRKERGLRDSYFSPAVLRGEGKLRKKIKGK